MGRQSHQTRFATGCSHLTMHEAHVRLAYIYLVEGDTDSAVQRMRESLLAFLEHHGIPPGKFHETLTRAWVLAVRHFMNKSGNTSGNKSKNESGNESRSTSAVDFIARNPELLDSRIMLTHYSASVLLSADARKTFPGINKTFTHSVLCYSGIPCFPYRGWQGITGPGTKNRDTHGLPYTRAPPGA